MSPIAVEAVALRSGTSADWAATTLVLGLGELGADTDTGTLKLGDGVTPWADLPASGGGGGFILDGTVTVTQITTPTTIPVSGGDLNWDDLPDGYAYENGALSGVPAGAYIAWLEVDFDTIEEDRVASLFVSVSGSGTGCNGGPLFAAADPSNGQTKILYLSGTIVVPEGASISCQMRSGVVNSTESPTPDPWDVSYASLLLAKIG